MDYRIQNNKMSVHPVLSSLLSAVLALCAWEALETAQRCRPFVTKPVNQRSRDVYPGLFCDRAEILSCHRTKEADPDRQTKSMM